MEGIEFYLYKMLEFEERGQSEAAIVLGRKILDVFPEHRERIFLELGKLKFRMGRCKEALLDLMNAYKISNNLEIYELILEIYLEPNKENSIRLYDHNLELLKNYPYYKNVYSEEIQRFFPIWQDEELLVCVDSFEKEFAMDVRKGITEFPKTDDICLILNEMWQEEIDLYEKSCRISEPFMDRDLPMYLVFDNLQWLLFLQLYDLQELLNRNRIVILVGTQSFWEYFESRECFFPSYFCERVTDIYIHLLDQAYSKRELEYELNNKVVDEYYQGKKQQIVENIKSGKPRILFETCRFTTAIQYHARDCMQAAERLGCETGLLIEKDGLDRVTTYRIKKMLAQLKPDIIFCIDHFRLGSDIPEEVVWITWVQDKLPQSTGNTELIRKLGIRDVVVSPFISDLQGRHWNMNYEMNVLKFPLSANISIYKKWNLTKQEKEQYSCDICYVANASDYRKMAESYKKRLPEWVHQDYQMVIDVYFQLMQDEVFFYGYESNLDVLWNIARELKINWPAELLYNLAEQVTIWISYSRYKSLVVEWLLEAGYTNIKLYGKEWGNDERFAPYAMGVIENGEKLSKVLQASKIVLGVHPAFSLSARVIEAIASGAFCLVNDIPEADIANAREYFVEGTELIYYYGKQDLIEKVAYYLNHSEEREKIIAAGQEKIRQELTYEPMWKRLFQEIGQLLENGEEVEELG